MKIGIWDKQEGRFVDDDDLMIGADGLVYEVAVGGGCDCCGSWLSREDKSRRYEARVVE